MKKVFLFLSVFATILTSITFVSSAQADDPAGTYAVLNNNNEVTNIIVCQASVCGGGTFGGEKIVLQVSNNPTGSQYGYLSNPGQPPVTYDPPSQTFTVSNGPQQNSLQINSPGNIIDQLSTTVSSTSSTFKAPKNINDSLPVLTESKTTDGSTATLSVTEINGAKCVSLNNQRLCETISQSLNFTTLQTAQQVLNIAIQNNLTLIQKNINTLIRMVYAGAIAK